MTGSIPSGDTARNIVTPWWSEEEEGLEEAELVEDELSDQEGESAPPVAVFPRDPLATVTLAEIYLAQGLYDQALQIYRDLATAEPGNNKLSRRIAEIESLRDADILTLAAPDSPESFPQEPAPGDSLADSSSDRAIAVLEEWLAHIERRRACR